MKALRVIVTPVTCYGQRGTSRFYVNEGDRPVSDTWVDPFDLRIRKPVTTDGVTTWDCIWFGDYWQEDTNKDGYCFSKDTTVTKKGSYYYDQDGKELYGFKGNAGTYVADNKQPIKWRVLDVDSEGNFQISS